MSSSPRSRKAQEATKSRVILCSQEEKDKTDDHADEKEAQLGVVFFKHLKSPVGECEGEDLNLQCDGGGWLRP